MDPQGAAEAGSPTQDQANKQRTVEQKLRQAVRETKRDENGKLVLPEGLTETEQFGVREAYRRGDTESSRSKLESQLKASKKTVESLTTKALNAPPEDSAEEILRMNDLKITDPDKWRDLKNKKEAAHEQAIRTEVQESETKATQDSIKESNEKLLEAFNQIHPNAQITDEVFEKDLPPRLKERYKKGDITFNQLLDEGHVYLLKNKVLGAPSKAKDLPNLGESGGTGLPQSATHLDQAVADKSWENTSL